MDLSHVTRFLLETGDYLKVNPIYLKRAKYLGLCVLYALRGILYAFIPSFFFEKDVSNETVLITGGGSGLGRLLAIRFAKLGAKVVIWDLNVDNMKETCQMIKDELESMKSEEGNINNSLSHEETCKYYVCDVSNNEMVYEVASRVKEEVGNISMLIMNAGIVNGTKLLDTPDDKIKNCFAVNTLSHFWLLKSFLPNMMEKDAGHIISIDSISAHFGTYNLVDYTSSKSASHRLQDSINNELKYSGYKNIRVTSVLPYFINTGMFAGATSSMIPILEPEYVADRIVSGIRCNRTLVYIPSYFGLLHTLTAAVPYKAYFFFHRAVFGGSMMRGFVGRSVPNTPSCTPSVDKFSSSETNSNYLHPLSPKFINHKTD